MTRNAPWCCAGALQSSIYLRQKSSGSTVFFVSWKCAHPSEGEADVCWYRYTQGKRSHFAATVEWQIKYKKKKKEPRQTKLRVQSLCRVVTCYSVSVDHKVSICPANSETTTIQFLLLLFSVLLFFFLLALAVHYLLLQFDCWTNMMEHSSTTVITSLDCWRWPLFARSSAPIRLSLAQSASANQ